MTGLFFHPAGLVERSCRNEHCLQNWLEAASILYGISVFSTEIISLGVLALFFFVFFFTHKWWNIYKNKIISFLRKIQIFYR